MTAAPDAPCTELPWDSGFFGVPIARVRAARLDDTIAAAVDAWVRERGVRCAYLFADIHDPETARAAQRHGYLLTDVRVTYERAVVEGDRAFAPPNVRALRPDERPAVESIARGAFRDSRFGFDGRFPMDLVDELYVRWVRSGLEAGDRKGVLVEAGAPGGGPRGFMVWSVDPDKPPRGEGAISLIGTAAAARGSGVGSALVAGTLGLLARRGVGVVTVVTQARNIGAQRLYQRAGFVLRSSELVYHRWWD